MKVGAMLNVLRSPACPDKEDGGNLGLGRRVNTDHFPTEI